MHAVLRAAKPWIAALAPRTAPLVIGTLAGAALLGWAGLLWHSATVPGGKAALSVSRWVVPDARPYAPIVVPEHPSVALPDVLAAHRRLAEAGFDVSAHRPGFKPGTRVCTVRRETCGVPTLLIGPDR